MAGKDSRRLAGISVRGAKRIKTVVEQVERTSPGRPGRRAAPALLTPGVFRAKVTTAIPTGSWDSPSSSGRVQLRHRDVSEAWVDDDRGPVEVWNDYTLTSSIPVNRVVRVAWISGSLWLVAGSCS